jgi:DNA (cytosine-5)-methyltransferase 1
VILSISNPFIEHLHDMPRVEDVKTEFNAVSLFSGGGGMDLGLTWAGFKVVFATDIEQNHCKTISYNFPDCITIAKDNTQLSINTIREATLIKEFDLLAGGPPCQAFSILGKRDSFMDPRGQLVFDYVRLVNEICPKVFVFENVPGIQTVNRGKDWKELLTYFEAETGYKIYHSVLNAADYGIPQIRKRVFIVGFQSNRVNFSFPEPTHSINDNSLFSGLLPNWLPSKLALDEVDNAPNHRIRIHGDRVRERYCKVEPGGRDKVDHTDRIHPDRPSGTVLVGSKAGGGRPFIHPYIPRHITVREAARLQSFPDWYEFVASDTWNYRAVGNAVPPLLAMYIGEKIKESLKRN